VKKRRSTIRGYRHIFDKHMKTRLGLTRLWGFRTVNGQTLLNEIEAETKLSHTSLKHIKHFLTGVFTFAKQRGHFESENPMGDVEIPEGEPSKDTHAYSLEEILIVIEKLPQPAKTVVATAAFTGLRRSELRGLKWEDYKGDELRVARSVWETHVVEGYENRCQPCVSARTSNSS
jgi:integrase